MRKLLILFLFVPCLIKAQAPAPPTAVAVDTTGGIIKFTEVIEMPGVTKTTLFNRAKDWLIRDFDYHHAHITMLDAAGGHIIAHATSYSDAKRIIDYNIYFDVKDGKYRYTFSEFTELSGLQFGNPSYITLHNLLNDGRNRQGGDLSSSARKRLKELAGAMNYIIVSLRSRLSSPQHDGQLLKSEDF